MGMSKFHDNLVMKQVCDISTDATVCRRMRGRGEKGMDTMVVPERNKGRDIMLL